MKKSRAVILGTVMIAAIAACKEKPKDEWIVGNELGRTRDTTMHGHGYRHFGGFWYPIVGGFISPNSFNGATAAQIANPSYRPARTSGVGRRAGGFGSSARGRSVIG